MQNTYKIPSLKLPFILILLPFFVLVTFVTYYFIATIGISGWPGIIIIFLIWSGLLYLIVIYFKTRGDNLYINDIGLKIKYMGITIDFDWDEIDKIGFQAISAKRMGVDEVTPYLAIGLRDVSKIKNLKSSREFGFIQKKNDLTLYMDQKDVLDLYVSMKFYSEKDSSILDFLLTKSIYIQKLKPLVKTSDTNEYKKVLYENFKV